MDYVYLGKITNTHGLKGEIKIISDFLKKELVFKPNFNIYIGEEKQREVINTYRVHQKYDMITLVGIDNIDDVIKYKGKDVYILKKDLMLDDKEILVEELKGFKIVNNGISYGKVIDIYKTKSSILLYVEYKNNYYIPYLGEFIKNINKEKKEIWVPRVGELV